MQFEVHYWTPHNTQANTVEYESPELRSNKWTPLEWRDMWRDVRHLGSHSYAPMVPRQTSTPLQPLEEREGRQLYIAAGLADGLEGVRREEQQLYGNEVRSDESTALPIVRQSERRVCVAHMHILEYVDEQDDEVQKLPL